MNTNFKLPTKWCIQRNPRNFEEINKLFKEINGKIYRANGRWRTAGGVFKEHDYLCFPAYEDKKYQAKRKPSGYTEISLEQLKKHVMSKNTKIISELPETWYVVVTEDILLDAFKWRFEHEYDEENNEYVLSNFKPGCIVGIYKWNRYGIYTSKEWQHGAQSIDNGWGQEISAEDFRFHVLKKYNREDWIEGRIALLNPDVKDPLLNTFIKECNPKNNNLTLCYENYENPKNKYLVANMDERVIEDYGKGFWKPFTTTDLPVVKDIKEIYANENIMKKETDTIENTVYGYKLRDLKYLPVVQKITSFTQPDRIITPSDKQYFEIAELGMIDEWFVAVSAPELPVINGYKGSVTNNEIKYGCAVLNIDWFTASVNRHIRELTLSSGVKITETQMTEIRNYLRFKKY